MAVILSTTRSQLGGCMRKPLRLFTAVLMGASALAAHGAFAQTALEQDMRYQDMATMTWRDGDLARRRLRLSHASRYPLHLPLQEQRQLSTPSASRRTTPSTNMAEASPARSRRRSAAPSACRGSAPCTVIGRASTTPNRNRCVSTNSSICAAADIVDTPGSLDRERQARSSRIPTATSTAGAWPWSSRRQIRGR